MNHNQFMILFYSIIALICWITLFFFGYIGIIIAMILGIGMLSFFILVGCFGVWCSLSKKVEPDGGKMEVQEKCPHCKSYNLSDGKSDFVISNGIEKLIQFCSDCHEEWFVEPKLNEGGE